jgi:hypothetical protein
MYMLELKYEKKTSKLKNKFIVKVIKLLYFY